MLNPNCCKLNKETAYKTVEDLITRFEELRLGSWLTNDSPSILAQTKSQLN